MKNIPFSSSGKEILGLGKVANNEVVIDKDLGKIEEDIIDGMDSRKTNKKKLDPQIELELELDRISKSIGVNLGKVSISESIPTPTPATPTVSPKSFDLAPKSSHPSNFGFSQSKPTAPRTVAFTKHKKKEESSDESDSTSSVSSSSTSRSSSSSASSSRSSSSSSASSRAHKKSHSHDRGHSHDHYRKPQPVRKVRYDPSSESEDEYRPKSPEVLDRQYDNRDAMINRQREQLRSFINEGSRNFGIGDYRPEVEQIDVLEMAAEIDQIRHNLIDAGADKSSLPDVNIERMAHSEIQRILFFYRRLDSQMKYKSLPEEIVLAASGFMESVFDGNTEILGKWKPDYTGLQNNIQSRLTKISPYMGRMVSEISQKHGISESAILLTQLAIPLITVPMSNKKKINKPTRNSITRAGLSELENL